LLFSFVFRGFARPQGALKFVSDGFCAQRARFLGLCPKNHYSERGSVAFALVSAGRQGFIEILAVGFNQSNFAKKRLVFLGNPQGRTISEIKISMVQPQSTKNFKKF